MIAFVNIKPDDVVLMGRSPLVSLILFILFHIKMRNFVIQLFSLQLTFYRCQVMYSYKAIFGACVWVDLSFENGTWFQEVPCLYFFLDSLIVN